MYAIFITKAACILPEDETRRHKRNQSEAGDKDAIY